MNKDFTGDERPFLIIIRTPREGGLKRKTAKEILAEAFREIAETKPVDKITVSDITENCGYSKTTFYRTFKDKYDLMAWDYSQICKMIMDRIGNNGYKWKHTLIDGAFMFRAQKNYLKNLLLNTNGYHGFFCYMKQLHFDLLKQQILESAHIKELNVKTEMYVREYCAGTVDLTCNWLLDAYNETPEEIAAIYEKCLPAPLCEYLL